MVKKSFVKKAVNELFFKKGITIIKTTNEGGCYVKNKLASFSYS